MSEYHVLVQAGQAAANHQQELIDGIKQIAMDVLGDDADTTRVHWNAVAKGFAWTGGEPSTTSVIRCDVPDDITYENRVRVLQSITNLWVERTGIDSNYVTVTT